MCANRIACVSFRNRRKGICIFLLVCSFLYILVILSLPKYGESNVTLFDPVPIIDNYPHYQNCSQPLIKSKIAFLKVHKCASSTIQNILFRFGKKNNLFFAQPTDRFFINYIGNGFNYITKERIESNPMNKIDFNILALHGKWNITYMREYFPKGTKFIAIVRNPIDLFLSLYDYESFGLFYTLKNYLKSTHVDGGRLILPVGLNQMLWDFGLQAGKFTSDEAVNHIVSEAEKTFDLVLVSERMTESLVLLRNLICADYEDIVTLKLNARNKETKSKNVKPDNETMALLREKLTPDFKLYNHFRRKFDLVVHNYGKERLQEEISLLEEAKERVNKKCEFGLGRNKRSIYDKKVSFFKTKSQDSQCVAMSTPELKFIDIIKMWQAQRMALLKLGPFV